MGFKIGDRVSFLNEVGEGEVVELSFHDEIRVLRDDGFDEWFRAEELVLRKSFSVENVVAKDENPKKSGYSEAVHRFAKKEDHEVDLHFDNLVDFPKNFQPFEMLQIQLRELDKALYKARRARVKKLIVIHGVGQGRLKEEVHQVLERQEDLHFYDASLAKYGRGATEVEFH